MLFLFLFILRELDFILFILTFLYEGDKHWSISFSLSEWSFGDVGVVCGLSAFIVFSCVLLHSPVWSSVASCIPVCDARVGSAAAKP